MTMTHEESITKSTEEFNGDLVDGVAQYLIRILNTQDLGHPESTLEFRKAVASRFQDLANRSEL